MSAATSTTTKAPTTANQTSQILWKTAGYALEGTALVGLLVLAPHLVKNSLPQDQADNFFLPVPDIHDAIAWTATAAIIWPIGRHALEAGATIHKELSGLPKKVGAYVYSLFPTKKYDEKKTTANLLYENSIWGAAHLSSLTGLYFGSSKIYRVVGIPDSVIPLIAAITSVAITGVSSWWLEKEVRKTGKTLVETLESSNSYRSLCYITQSGWDFVSSHATPMTIGLLAGMAAPIQSTISAYLKTATDTTQAVANSYPGQVLAKTAAVIGGLFSSLFQGLFVGATYVKDGIQNNYTTYAHPYVSEGYNFTKTALFYSTIQDLCDPQGQASNDAKEALAKDLEQKQTYETAYQTYTQQAENKDLDEQTQTHAKEWVKGRASTYEAQYSAYEKQAQDTTLDPETQNAAKQFMQKNPKHYENLHRAYTQNSTDLSRSEEERRQDLLWLRKHPQDLTKRCPHAENITTKVNYVKYLSSIAAAVYSWSRLKDSCPSADTPRTLCETQDTKCQQTHPEWANYDKLSQEDKDLCPYIQEVTPWLKPINEAFTQTREFFGRGYEIASDPTTQKVALLTIAAGIGLYWIHAFGTKAFSTLSRQEDKDPSQVDDTDELPEEGKSEEHPEPSAPPLPEEVVEDVGEKTQAEVPESTTPASKDPATRLPEETTTPPPEETPSVKPLAARTWSTKLSEALSSIAKKIQNLWTSFCGSCTYYVTQTQITFEDFWERLKRQMASLRKTPQATLK